MVCLEIKRKKEDQETQFVFVKQGLIEGLLTEKEFKKRLSVQLISSLSLLFCDANESSKHTFCCEESRNYGFLTIRLSPYVERLFEDIILTL